MTRYTLIALAALTFTACGSAEPDEDDGAGEEELITEGMVTLTPVGGGDAQTLMFSDPDGEGGDDPTFSGSLALQTGTSYDGTITVRDGINDEDITAEIRAEAEEHLFRYRFEPASIGTVALTDAESDYTTDDENGGDFAVGLTFRVAVTGAAGTTGGMRTILYHFDDAPKTGSDVIGPETDIEIVLPVSVAIPS